MLNQQTMSILHSLKLYGMAKGLEERSANTQHAELSHEEFVGLSVQDEKMYRDNLRLQRLLKKAKPASMGVSSTIGISTVKAAP